MAFFVPTEVPLLCRGDIMVPVLEKLFLSVMTSLITGVFAHNSELLFLAEIQEKLSPCSCSLLLLLPLFSCSVPCDECQISFKTGQECRLRLGWLWSVNDLCTGPGSQPFLGSFETQFKRTQLNIWVSIIFLSFFFFLEISIILWILIDTWTLYLFSVSLGSFFLWHGLICFAQVSLQNGANSINFTADKY